MSSEERLVAGVQNGDAEAITEAYRRYWTDIANFIFRMAQNADTTEDLTQEVFVRMVTKASSFKGTGSFKSWLLAIAINITRDYLSGSNKEKPMSSTGHSTTQNLKIIESIESTGDLPPETVEKVESGNAIAKALMALPESQRVVVVLRHYHNMKLNEIAQTLGESENTIKSRMRYALLKLRQELKEFEE
jgi:RNA polymerase sigma-70 factor (ECF subfamily)